MRFQSLHILLLLLLVPLVGFGQPQKLQSFPLSSVRLLDSPFLQAQQTDMNYILALDPDRLLAPYRTEAGIDHPAKPYGNWENTGLNGHIGGHYLTALALMYASNGNAAVEKRLNYMIDQLEICQQKNGNGYLGGIPGGKAMWQEIAQGKIEAENFSLNGKWVPWYNIHKLYAGLRDAYLLTGNQKAREMLIKLTDWSLNLVANLSDEQIQEMLRSEHGGMNEVFADVAAITGEEKYLQLARQFSDERILNPLLSGKDALTGLHANTQIPKVIGYKRIAEVGGDASWAQAADFFWKTVVDNRTASIGGNSVREHFHPTDNYSSMIESREGPETCNTYNMLKLSKQLFLDSASADYIGYYERAMYNHILSSQHPEKGGFVYFTPMRPRHYRVYSQAEQNFWCCVGSGLENHGKYGELIYAHNNKDIFVNLFIPSKLSWKEKGISLEQLTTFPYEEASKIKLTLKKPQQFALNIRKPEWVKAEGLKVRVNNKEVKIKNASSGYLTVERKWKSGDEVTISLPMQTKAEFLPDQSPWVSFVHGPIVLAAVTDTTDLQGLFADSSRMGHIATGPLYPIEEAPLLVAANKNVVSALVPVKDKPMTFKLSGIYPEASKQLELVPFFQVHDARYMVYWPVASPENLDSIKSSLRAREEAAMALRARTVDQVSPGEQQPESDHNYKGEKTESGVNLDKHWRHAHGWFSYDLKNTNKQAKALQLTYFGLDKGRTFDIYLNDKLLRTVTLDGSKGANFFTEDYIIPQEILKKNAEVLRVKFVAHPGSIAGGIYGVRLLK
jgi:DUF1680 family protein